MSVNLEYLKFDNNFRLSCFMVFLVSLKLNTYYQFFINDNGNYSFVNYSGKLKLTKFNLWVAMHK